MKPIKNNAFERGKKEEKENKCKVNGCEEQHMCSECHKCQDHHDEDTGFALLGADE